MGRTGVQVMQVNTLYQLVSHFQGKAFLRQAARHFLTIPDLLNYWLTGMITNVCTISTTAQIYNPRKKDWDRELMAALEIPAAIFGPICA
jgi:rhamnulokinase